MKKSKIHKIILSSLITLLVLCFTSPVISQPQIATPKKTNLGIVGFSNSALDIIEFIRENYGKDFNIVQVKSAEQIDDTFQIIIAFHSEFIKIQSCSYYDNIYNRIKAGLLALLLLEEIMETSMKIQEITYNMTLNLDNGAQTSGLISTESKMITFQYHAYVEYHRSNGIEVIKRYESKTYKDYIKWLKNSLVNIIENFESKSSDIVKAADDSQWIKKKEIIGENDFGDYEIYTRIDIYKCIYTDISTDPWSDYYRIDYFVHHNVKNFQWEEYRVGPYAYKRIMYADANYENQELYFYGPTGTVGSIRVSYNINFGITIPSGVSIGVGYSRSWDQPEVKITDQSSMVNDYAQWTESFSGPDYGGWPNMDFCNKPCLVSRSSFYSLPSLVVQVPNGTGLCMPHLDTEYRFAIDHKFYKIFFILFFTRTIYVINDWTSWMYVCIDKGGNGGGCPILSIYNGEQYIEEGLLDIHAYEDVIERHTLTTTPQLVDNKYFLRLTEHPMTNSHIDQVHLLAILKNGKRIVLPLLSALHSTNGNVTNELLLNDDIRVDCLGANFNNGESESITLEFLALKDFDIQEFIFLIEGYNMFVK